ncbi:MAG: hypothetical protein M1824_000569 [Vezdaea acicularis]|nr:MAG: hypothetical protein M1824_000569 [Vezdaea acicularis]
MALSYDKPLPAPGGNTNNDINEGQRRDGDYKFSSGVDKKRVQASRNQRSESISSDDEEWWSDDDPLASKASKDTTVPSMNGYGSNQAVVTAAPSKAAPPRAYSVVKLKREKSKGRQRAQNALAGIKVITDISVKSYPQPVRAQPKTQDAKRTVLEAPQRGEASNGPQTAWTDLFSKTPEQQQNRSPKSRRRQAEAGVPVVDKKWKAQTRNNAPAPAQVGQFINLMDLAGLNDTKEKDNDKMSDWLRGIKEATRQKQRSRGHRRIPTSSSNGSSKGKSSRDLAKATYTSQQSQGRSEKIASELVTGGGLGLIVAEATKNYPENSSKGFLGHGRNPSNNSKGLAIEPLRLGSSISPSDGKIFIGLSVPSAKASEFALSPESATAAHPYHNEAHDPNSATTPTILVTSAEANSKWEGPQRGADLSSQKARARSSIYSTVTPYGEQPNNAVIPPMPTKFAKAHQLATVSKQHEGVPRESVITVFEEDEMTPRTGEPHSAISSIFFGSRLRALSIDTLAKERSSKGWWDHIKSPFMLSRSSTNASRHGLSPTEDAPELPSLAHAAEIAQRHDDMKKKIWQKQSPVSPEDVGPKSGHTTIWTDLSGWEAEREAKFQGQHNETARGIEASPNGTSVVGDSTGKAAPLVPISEHEGLNYSYYHPEEKNEQWLSPGNPTSPPRFLESPQVKSPDDVLSPNDREVPFILADDSKKVETERQVPDPVAPKKIRPLFIDTSLKPGQQTTRAVPGSPLPDEVETPTVHEANAVRYVQARSSIQSTDKKPISAMKTPPKPDSYSPFPPPYTGRKPPQVIINNTYSTSHNYVQSPGPLSAGLRRAIGANRGGQMTQVPLTPAAAEKGPKSEFEHPSQQWPPVALPERPARRRLCFGKTKEDKKKKKVWFWWLGGGIALLILIVVLAMTVHKKSSNPVISSQWMNNTGYPPMPTGVATIVQPSAVAENSGCIAPSTMWSCALPKELQSGILPNRPDEPNFTIEILYRNGTLPSSKRAAKRSLRSFSSRILHPRDAATDANFTPDPSPPSVEEMAFLGNTTDGVVAPNKAGEPTPFYASFLSNPNTPSSPLLHKRDQSFPDALSAIPPPATNPDGTAHAATLLPLPLSQPLRLYDRGLQTEHYAFYTYFDRAIFLSADIFNDSSAAPSPADATGGALEKAARVRCTWSQTRFLVQIWTQPKPGKSLLGNHSVQSPSATPSTSQKQPGSFPYPLTLTLDRHGGSLTQKFLYCYGLDSNQQPLPSQKQFMQEQVGAGGQLVGGGSGPLGGNVSLEQGGWGGIDGGSGGCSCRWQNWIGTD